MGEHELFNGNLFYSDGNIDTVCTGTYAGDIGASNAYTLTKYEDPQEVNLILNNLHNTTFSIDWKDASTLMIKEILNDEKEEEAMDLHPVKIIFNDPVSVVFWEDGEKTVVRRHEGEPYDKYTAFCAALAIKIFGSNTEVNRIVRNGIDQQEKDKKKAEKYKKQTADK